MLDHSPVPDLTALLQQIEHGRSEPAPTSETAEEHVAGPMYRSPELAVLVAVTAGLTAGVCKLLGRGRLRWRGRDSITKSLPDQAVEVFLSAASKPEQPSQQALDEGSSTSRSPDQQHKQQQCSEAGPGTQYTAACSASGQPSAQHLAAPPDSARSPPRSAGTPGSAPVVRASTPPAHLGQYKLPPADATALSRSPQHGARLNAWQVRRGRNLADGGIATPARTAKLQGGARAEQELDQVRQQLAMLMAQNLDLNRSRAALEAVNGGLERDNARLKSRCLATEQDRDARLHTLEANTSHLARSCGALERDKVRLQKEVAKLKLMLSVKDYGSDSCA